MAQVSRTAPLLTVSVAAELAGMHPQTVRQYDRLGLVVAQRTRGGGRRYSLRDVDKLVEVQRLSQEEGISLPGIARILQLQDEVERLSKRNAKLERKIGQLGLALDYLREQLEQYTRRENRVFAVNTSGDVTMAERFDVLRRILREEERMHLDDTLGDHELVLWHPQPLYDADYDFD